MLGKVLSPWCKRAKIEMIVRDINVVQLSEMIGRSREYTSSVINGRAFSMPVVQAISDVLNIPETVNSFSVSITEDEE